MKDKRGTEIKVGDRVRHDGGSVTYTVEGVGAEWVVAARDDQRCEMMEFPEYVEVVAPDVVLWCNVYPSGQLMLRGAPSRNVADTEADTDRIGVLEVNVTQRTATWHEVVDTWVDDQS
jgi:hypothetical protein